MLDIALHNCRQHRQFQHSEGPLVLARMGREHSLWLPVDSRRSQVAEALLEIVPKGDGIAVSMDGCRAESFCGRTCTLSGSCQLPVPTSFAIGDTLFEICDSVSSITIPVRPLERLHLDKSDVSGNDATLSGPAPATISRWFAAIGSLNRWTMSLQELYAQAARCAVESIGLDGAVVLRRRDEHWEIADSYLPNPELSIHCDLSILDEVLRTPETLFHGSASPLEWAADFHSQQHQHGGRSNISTPPAVVVSPLRNAAGETVGAVYGYRSVRGGNTRRAIRYLEAHMIELLAGAVSDGIARLEQELEVERRRALMERAFAATLNNEPKKILSEKREVTLLFADLRRSTSLSAVFEIDQLCELVGQVLDCLSTAVMDHDGVVIDYYGDGLAAMWNAPADQCDHSELACRAAWQMLETLPDVAADWADVLDAELRLAMGVHTGIVRVGNAGSTRRTKYGPRGRNVHVASRAEAAAKELNVPLIVTQHAVERLSNRFRSHRICRARIRGVQQAIDLFHISPAATEPMAEAAWKSYGEALLMFEQGQFSDAVERLKSIATPLSDTLPAQFLADHVQWELNRQRRRRSSDKADSEQKGVIPLGAK